jgi:hypothetical protein
MWTWMILTIGGSILGSATDSWFSQTKFGIWFYAAVDKSCTWAAEKLNIKLLEDDKKWRKKYPHIAFNLDNIEKRLKQLENNVD